MDERIPIYKVIQNDIKSKIASGELGTDDKISSEQELMKEYDVSRITVSNALRKMAEDKWIYRVPGKGSFVNDDIQDLIAEFNKGQNIKSQSNLPVLDPEFKNKTIIGIVVPFITDYYTENYINGIMSELNTDDYSVIIKVVQDKKNEPYIINELLSLGVDGMCIFPYDRETYNEELLAMKLDNFPFVLIDRHLPGVDTNYVSSNNYLGGRLAAKHLIDLGHHNICMCTGLIKPIRTQSVQDRIEGFHHELTEKGIVINPDFLITELDLDYDNFEGFEGNDKLLSLVKNKEITAIIALSTGYTLYIYTMLRNYGIRVPEDISLVSFDNPMPNCRDLEFFTHIDQSEYEQGKRSATILKNLISSKQQDEQEVSPFYYKEIIDPKIVIRKSTAKNHQ